MLHHLGCDHIHPRSLQPYAIQAGVIANATNSAKLAAAAAEKRAGPKGRRLSATDTATEFAAAASWLTSPVEA